MAAICWSTPPTFDPFQVSSPRRACTGSRSHEIALITDGRGLLDLDGAAFDVGPYRLFITEPGEIRRWRLERPGLGGLIAFFEADFVNEFFGDRKAHAAATAPSDFSIPQRIFDVRYPDLDIVGGYYPSAPTPAGRTEGLRTFAIGYMAIDPHQDVTVLSLDEYGKASSWLRRYGGPEGMGLLQLTFPRQELADLSEFQAVIEYGVTW